MDLSNCATVLPIIVICYLVGILCKNIKLVSDNIIPVIVGTVGAIIAVPAMNIVPDFPATDIITAISVGIVSGLASTGVNQIYKQLK